MKKQQLWIDLSDEQAEKVVGGVGVGDVPGAGINGWFGGTPPGNGAGLAGSAGFSPPGEQMSPGESGLTVTVPGSK